jgi:hypothetical protein
MSQYIVVKPFAGLELGSIVEPNEQYSEDFLSTLVSGGFLHATDEAGASDEVKEDENVSPVADAVEEEKAVPATPVAPAAKSFVAEAKEVVRSATKEAIRENISKSLRKSAPKFAIPASPKTEDVVKGFGLAISLALNAAKGCNTSRNKLDNFYGKSFDGKNLTFQKAPTGNATTTAALGASLKIQRWSDELHKKALGYGSLLEKCKVIPCPDGSDTYNHPVVNDVSRADGSRPARHYIVGQSDALTISKIPFENVQLV